MNKININKGRLWIFVKNNEIIGNLYKLKFFRNHKEIDCNVYENYLEIMNINCHNMLELFYIANDFSTYLDGNCLIFGDCLLKEDSIDSFSCNYVSFFKKSYRYKFETISKQDYYSLQNFSINNFCKIHKLRISKNRKNLFEEFNIF